MNFFDKKHVEYFGYTYSKDGMKPSTATIKALKHADRPRDTKSIRGFLGMKNYLKRFI